MRRLAPRVAAVLVATGLGAAVAYATREVAAGAGARRPAAVERVTRALDRLEPATSTELAAALVAAGTPAGFASPWREELELAALVLGRDREALARFGTASPPAPARARARLRLALDAKDPALRAQAIEALRRAYPASAAARVFAPRPRGDGR